MPYKLEEKENAFQVTREGVFEFHRFEHGTIYDRIPEEEKSRFEEIGAPQEETSKKQKGVKEK